MGLSMEVVPLEPDMYFPANMVRTAPYEAAQRRKIAKCSPDYNAPVTPTSCLQKTASNRDAGQRTERNHEIACCVVPAILVRIAELTHADGRQ